MNYRKPMKALTLAAVMSLTSLTPLVPSISQNPYAPITAYAASKIHSVSIRFTINGYDDAGMPEIEAVKTNDTDSEHYSVGMLALEESTNDSEINYRDAKYGINLSADDGYTFSITSGSQVHLGGAGATYVSSAAQDNSTTLHIVLTFHKPDEFCSEISIPTWDSTTATDANASAGRLSWKAAQYAHQMYRVAVYNGNTLVGEAYTGATRYDCRPFMLTAGSYYARITPKTDSAKGTPMTSAHITISAEQAAANAASFALQKEAVSSGSDGSTVGPGSVTWKVLNAGWKQTGNKKWYQNIGGDYIQYNWLKEGDSWYFFDADGAMVTNTSVAWKGTKYYFGTDGKMVTNATIPDGRKAGADGRLSGTITNADKVKNLGGEVGSNAGTKAPAA